MRIVQSVSKINSRGFTLSDIGIAVLIMSLPMPRKIGVIGIGTYILLTIIHSFKKKGHQIAALMSIYESHTAQTP